MMTEARQPVQRMEDAYRRGDQRSAAAQARELLADRSGDVSEQERAAAQRMLEQLEPDIFLLVVGALGLGLTVWLVYNYVL